MSRRTGAETWSASAFDVDDVIVVVFVIISSNNRAKLTCSLHCEPFNHFGKANFLGNYAVVMVVLQRCARFPEFLTLFTGTCRNLEFRRHRK